MSTGRGFNTLCMSQPLNNIIAQHGVEKGGNVMGLDYWMNGEDGIMFLATLAVNGAENEAASWPIIGGKLDGLLVLVGDVGISTTLYWTRIHFNGNVGSGNVAKLKAASLEYNPDGVFQKLRLSGLKIPTS